MPVLSRRNDPDQRRHQEDALIAATIALLEEGTSYASLSIAAIAERAGQTRTAFYQYFRDKRELLLTATSQVMAGVFDEADRWWSGSGGQADLHPALQNIAAHYRGSRFLMRALVEAAGYDEVVADYWNAEIGRFVDATTARLVRDGLERSEAAEIASALVWMIERTCYQLSLDPDDHRDAARVDALVTIWTRTLQLEG